MLLVTRGFDTSGFFPHLSVSCKDPLYVVLQKFFHFFYELTLSIKIDILVKKKILRTHWFLIINMNWLDWLELIWKKNERTFIKQLSVKC